MWYSFYAKMDHVLVSEIIFIMMIFMVLYYVALPFVMEYILHQLFVRLAKEDFVNKNGVTILMDVSLSGKSNLFKAVMEQQPNVTETDIEGNSPLIYAIKSGNNAIVLNLLENKADINGTNTNEWSPIMEAVYNGDSAIVSTLLNQGVEINRYNIFGHSALYIAAYHGHTNIVRMLLDNGAICTMASAFNENPLYVAMDKNHPAIVEMLLEYKAESGIALLISAVQHNRSDIVEYIVKSGVDVNEVNKNGIPLIREAIIGNLTNIVSIFAKSGANVSCFDLKTAALRDYSEIFKTLIQTYVVNPSQNDSCLYEILVQAATCTNLNIIKIVLDYKPRANSRTCKGDTPLLESRGTDSGTDSIDSKLLIENGANVNDMDQFWKHL